MSSNNFPGTTISIHDYAVKSIIAILIGAVIAFIFPLVHLGIIQRKIDKMALGFEVNKGDIVLVTDLEKQLLYLFIWYERYYSVSVSYLFLGVSLNFYHQILKNRVRRYWLLYKEVRKVISPDYD